MISLSQIISFLGFLTTACENGTYGQDCNNTCGHCLEEGYCEHTNGTCFSGCLPGYLGDLCKLRK